MFENGVPDVMECGCTLTYRASGTTELVFLTPCTQAHREVALRIRGARPGRSAIVVKAPREAAS